MNQKALRSVFKRDAITIVRDRKKNIFKIILKSNCKHIVFINLDVSSHLQIILPLAIFQYGKEGLASTRY